MYFWWVVECSPVFFGIGKRFGPMNLYVIAYWAFMFIIGSDVTSRDYILYSIVYDVSDKRTTTTT